MALAPEIKEALGNVKSKYGSVYGLARTGIGMLGNNSMTSVLQDIVNRKESEQTKYGSIAKKEGLGISASALKKIFDRIGDLTDSQKKDSKDYQMYGQLFEKYFGAKEKDDEPPTEIDYRKESLELLKKIDVNTAELANPPKVEKANKGAKPSKLLTGMMERAGIGLSEKEAQVEKAKVEEQRSNQVINLLQQIDDNTEKTSKQTEKPGLLSSIADNLIQAIVGGLGGKGLMSAAGGLLGGGLIKKGVGAVAGLAGGALAAGKGVLSKGVDLAKTGIGATTNAIKGVGSAAADKVATAGKALVTTGKEVAGNAITAAKAAPAKELLKAGGKSLLKKIPLIGAIAGVALGAQRLFNGDPTGAGLEVASGLASTLPGIGTAASVGIDAALLARDLGVVKSDNGNMLENLTDRQDLIQKKPASVIAPSTVNANSITSNNNTIAMRPNVRNDESTYDRLSTGNQFYRAY